MGASCNSPTPISVASQGECEGAGPMENQIIDWHFGMTPAKLCVTPGTNVTFNWTSGHTMQKVEADSFESVCNDVVTTPLKKALKPGLLLLRYVCAVSTVPRG